VLTLATLHCATAALLLLLLYYHATLQKGFNPNYSAPGLWGHGTYFARSAAYSNMFAHHLPATGERQLFLCLVLLGKPYDCGMQEQHSWREPPVLPTTAAASAAAGSGGATSSSTVAERYDSVHAVTQGHNIFVTYDQKAVYPEYLVTYKVR
jgi:Poly(ADP-ribose) polymerase catalytic domain